MTSRTVAPVVAVLLVLAVALTGCAPPGDADRRERDRYRACLDAGGSYQRDDVDYSCTVRHHRGGRA